MLPPIGGATSQIAALTSRHPIDRCPGAPSNMLAVGRRSGGTLVIQPRRPPRTREAHRSGGEGPALLIARLGGWVGLVTEYRLKTEPWQPKAL
jgi:hypothetical protein